MMVVDLIREAEALAATARQTERSASLRTKTLKLLRRFEELSLGETSDVATDLVTLLVEWVAVLVADNPPDQPAHDRLMVLFQKVIWLRRATPTGPNAIDVVFAGGLTEVQKSTFLEVLGDLFESAGGRGGLKIVGQQEVPDHSREFAS